MADRAFPQSEDAEKGALCSCFLSPNKVLTECLENGITVDHFYFQGNQLIFRAMSALQNAGKPIDMPSVTQILKDHRKLSEAGGVGYVTDVFLFVPTATNADYYLDILRDKFLLRQLISTCTTYATKGFEEKGDPKKLLDEAEEQILKIGAATTSSTIATSAQCVTGAIERYEAAQKNGGAVVGLKTGLPRLDSLLRGLRGGQMIVISAKQKRGKSSLAWQIADHNSITCQPSIAVGGCSLEMGKAEITDRRMAMLGRIDLSRLDSGNYSQDDITRIKRAGVAIGQSKVYIKDEAGMNILQIKATLRRMVREYGIKLGIIDYLQIITPLNSKDGRERAVAEMSMNIKQVARELDIPILVLCQLNKTGDARESAAIEMDCDKFIVIEAEDDESWEDDPEPLMNLRVKYNRAGPCGKAQVKFLKKFTAFESV